MNRRMFEGNVPNVGKSIRVVVDYGLLSYYAEDTDLDGRPFWREFGSGDDTAALCFLALADGLLKEVTA